MNGYGLQGRQLYFAYGSNLVARQMTARCPSARVAGPAYLDGWRITFGGYSPSWQGAVADVVRSEGARVPGVLYWLDPSDLERLDSYEGHPHTYTRRRLWVAVESGRRCVAHVYVQTSYMAGCSVSVPYFKAVYNAYRRRGFDTAALLQARKAHNEEASAMLEPGRLVFVYGTLMKGQGNHRLLVEAERLGEAYTEPSFELYSLGGFPGMICGGRDAVRGELYRVNERTLDALDRLEGHPNFYVRSMIRLRGGEVVETYLLDRQQVEGCRRIESADWRRRNTCSLQLSWPWEVNSVH